MTKKELYRHLIEIASRQGIRVSEQNLRITHVNAQSGLVRVKDEYVFIMEKNLPVSEKANLLAGCLRSGPGSSLDGMYIVPAVREFIFSTDANS